MNQLRERLKKYSQKTQGGRFECVPSDGLYSKNHLQCRKCDKDCRNICMAFAVIKGMTSKEDL